MLALNSFLPVTMWYRTAPTLHISTAVVCTWCLKISGAMVSKVPAKPVGASHTLAAQPKSEIFNTPFVVSKRFSGLISLWMMSAA